MSGTDGGLRAALAALPLALVLVAMLAWRWRAATAGLLGLGAALGVALGAFGLGTARLAAFGPAGAVGGALLEALFTAATILWIVFPALCLHELQQATGALDRLREGLTRLADAPHVLVLLVAFFGALVLEGAAGFGTPIALVAPVLGGLGFAPAEAVALALVGHAAGVSFGAVGTPVLPQVAATGLPPLTLARWTAALHAAVGWVLVLALLRLVVRRAPATARPSWRVLAGDALAASLAFFVPFAAIAAVVGPELPTLGGAAVGLPAYAAFVRHRARRARPRAATPGPDAARGMAPAAAAPSARALARAALPYALLLALVLATRLVPPVREALQGVRWAWTIGDVFGGDVRPLYQPGTLLLAAFVVGGLAQGRPAAALAAAAGRAVRRLGPVVVALVAMLALARVAVHGGLIQALADAAAGAGAAWPFLAPFVGVLGTFVTGSATASNILFADFQQATATAAGLPVAPLQGGQGFGAAVGNIVCPHNVVAGGATVGLAGREGEVLRTTAPACLAYVVAGGAVLWLLVQVLARAQAAAS